MLLLIMTVWNILVLITLVRCIVKYFKQLNSYLLKEKVSEKSLTFFVYFCLRLQLFTFLPPRKIQRIRSAVWGRFYMDPYIYILDNKKRPGDVLERKKRKIYMFIQVFLLEVRYVKNILHKTGFPRVKQINILYLLNKKT